MLTYNIIDMKKIIGAVLHVGNLPESAKNVGMTEYRKS
jgi:hypothetical protein